MSDEKLVRYLLDEMDEDERLQVKSWIDTSMPNKRYFEHFELIWRKSKQLEKTSTINENAAWERFQKRISQPQQPAPVMPINKKMNWLRVAATVIVTLAVLSVYLIMNMRSNQPVSLASHNTTLTDTLPDESIVTLNKNSTLTYEEKSGAASYRKTKLAGEAFFNVRADKSKPFIVEVDRIEVEVVGTSFNIKSVAGRTEIIVESGTVSVTKNNTTVTLTRGEKIVIPLNAELPEKQKNQDRLYNYYRSKEFVCDNTPLWKLIEVLNEAYGTDIVIENPKARMELYTTTFSNEPIDKILDIIAETFDLSVTRKNNKIILK
jgi:transmembrane sensor